jgi:site-specific recombinase XerC
MVAAMVLGGLRRCEVLGLRVGDLRFTERRVFVAEGKGGHQRLIPVSARFFTAVSAYLDAERPADPGTDQVFVVLKGRAAACRCRLTGWMRSWTAPAAGPGWPVRPATSCAIPA